MTMTMTETCMEMEALMTLAPTMELSPDDREKLDIHVAECAGCFASAAELIPAPTTTARQVPSRVWIGATVVVAAAVVLLVVILQRPQRAHLMEHGDLAFANQPTKTNQVSKTIGSTKSNKPTKATKTTKPTKATKPTEITKATKTAKTTKSATKRPTPKPSRRLTIVGRAVEATQPGPQCGVLAVAQRVRYQVLKVIKGQYTNKRVDVTLPCSSVPVGAIDKLELGPKPNHKFSWTIMGKLSKPPQPAYWMLRRSKP